MLVASGLAKEPEARGRGGLPRRAGRLSVCGMVGSLLPRTGPPATLQGDAVHVELRLHAGTPLLNNLELAARRTAELVYQAAQQHSEASQVVVAIWMSKNGV